MEVTSEYLAVGDVISISICQQECRYEVTATRPIDLEPVTWIYSFLLSVRPVNMHMFGDVFFFFLSSLVLELESLEKPSGNSWIEAYAAT